MTDLRSKIFHDEDAARRHLEAIRWPNGPYCPHCGNADQDTITALKGKSHRPGLYQCNECREHFTVTVGSVMERSHIPLTKWVLGFHLMNASKKGISAHQLYRMLDLGSYRTAWFMAHRIREAMSPSKKPTGMGGPGKAVQADETYYGDTSRRSKAGKLRPRGKHGNKAVIIRVVDPSTGAARGFHVKSATGDTIRDILFTNVHRTSTLVSDESNLYRYTGKAFGSHETVTHWKAEYVNKDGFTTNNVENLFGVFKKGMVGTYHFCSQKHFQRYLDEFSFRYTHRSGIGISDGERATLAIKGAAGKRLTYRQPVDAAHA